MATITMKQNFSNVYKDTGKCTGDLQCNFRHSKLKLNQKKIKKNSEIHQGWNKTVCKKKQQIRFFWVILTSIDQ